MTERLVVVPPEQAAADAVKRPVVDKVCGPCGSPVGEWPIAFRGDNGCSVACQKVLATQEVPDEPRVVAWVEGHSEDQPWKWVTPDPEEYAALTTCPGCGARITHATLGRVQPRPADPQWWHENCYREA